MLTSRSWFKSNIRINPDKMMCWEHLKFADLIINELDQVFDRQAVLRWPPVLEVNSVLRFQDLKLVA